MHWRLLGANNRPLARAADSQLDDDACLQDLRVLQARLAEVPVRLTGTAGSWGWRVEVPGCVGALSARSYLRRSEALAAFGVFARLLPEAGLPLTVPDHAVAAPRRPDLVVTS